VIRRRGVSYGEFELLKQLLVVSKELIDGLLLVGHEPLNGFPLHLELRLGGNLPTILIVGELWNLLLNVKHNGHRSFRNRHRLLIVLRVIMILQLVLLLLIIDELLHSELPRILILDLRPQLLYLELPLHAWVLYPCLQVIILILLTPYLKRSLLLLTQPIPQILPLLLLWSSSPHHTHCPLLRLTMVRYTHCMVLVPVYMTLVCQSRVLPEVTLCHLPDCLHSMLWSVP
jgi:hypothetical protein